MNDSAMALFRTIQQALPYGVDQMVGKDINAFHVGEAQRIAHATAESAYPITSQIRVADQVISFNASAVNDQLGQFDSVVVTYNDITENERLVHDFEANVGHLVNELIEAGVSLHATSEAMTAMAQDSSTQAGNVSGSATVASENVLTVAGAAEELAASINEIARQVDDAANVSGHAVVEADLTHQTVTKLSASSNEIEAIIEVISEIADKTNLLALNASIEAARAGDAGKGFSVVAGEVKDLARQTSEATLKISDMIKAIQEDSASASKTIDSITSTIHRINEINQSISVATEQQHAATKEIAQSVHYASDATRQVTEAIASVSSSVQGTGQSASEMFDASIEVRAKSDNLKDRVQDFLATLRSYA